MTQASDATAMRREAAGVAVTPGLLRDWPLPVPQGSKESRGRVLILGGSRRNPGGVRLAAEAALRSGAGKVQIVTAESVATLLAVNFPEALVHGAPETEDGELAPEAAEIVMGYAPEAEVLLAGPGMLDVDAARALMAAVLPQLSEIAVVLDALALAWVTENPQGLSHLSGRTVLSPNAAELALTLRRDPPTIAEADLPEAVAELARLAGGVVAGGAETTYVAHADSLWRIETGGPGLATAGSGDTKAGVVSGLIARGASVEQATVWGAHVHGSAGERLASRVGATGFLAREITAEVPRILSELDV